MAKKFAEMTEVEKKDAFETWAKGKEGRQATSKRRRAATQALIKKYADEFNKLLKAQPGA